MFAILQSNPSKSLISICCGSRDNLITIGECYQIKLCFQALTLRFTEVTEVSDVSSHSYIKNDRVLSIRKFVNFK